MEKRPSLYSLLGLVLLAYLALISTWYLFLHVNPVDKTVYVKDSKESRVHISTTQSGDIWIYNEYDATISFIENPKTSKKINVINYDFRNPSR
ncbi:hypothetical protein O0555_06200 [Brevibacillus laterosporus]|uniref:hypothetical protein n=1 Tax=Brevibacillus laterosporus TaxID=1465 RepID=UPI0018CDA400|nr:hypothetical protein [Brevibacillus laterosporus]MBG9798165.1 hypothetical protein [Brevibacillus laterosporus]MCR8936943.1 hypothetical protein [Brevibacillus laterosporus]MCZ0839581.1 hypothetical protein [Brevibacillus laterosporus]MCZ0845671.1 hypothetical protein [Brevibacillus laterosporus]MED1913508.1 hypothetical protein [Brevibacillus laterosporus]